MPQCYLPAPQHKLHQVTVVMQASQSCMCNMKLTHRWC